MAIPTTDQLRARIDQGQTGEKIAVPDPATVPLGTDAEAGGSSPTPADRQIEAQSAPVAPRESRAPAGSMIYILLVACLAFALIAIVALAAL